MRIAMIGSRGVPAHYGGVETVVQELSTRLVARGHDVTVYCRAEDYDEHPPTWHGVRCVYLRTPGGRISGASVHALRASIDALRGHYDVVHYHAMGPSLFAPLTRLSASKVVATVAGRDDLRAKWGPVARRFMRVAAWSTAKVPDATIVVSQELQQEFREVFRCEAEYVPNGISPLPPAAWSAEEQVSAVRRRGLEPGRYLLNVGRLVPEKRLDLLLRGFARLDDPDLRLAVAGDDCHSAAFDRTVQQLAAQDPRVRLLGPVYGNELDALFRHALGFVTASGLEGMPMTLLEACAYGLPVVVSDIRPHLEIVDHEEAVWTFPSGDEAALAAALRDLLATPAAVRDKTADILRAEVLQRYDWEAIVDRTAEIYASLLS
jgi:glycosyltransferase involved in cell wall biosynthesis